MVHKTIKIFILVIAILSFAVCAIAQTQNCYNIANNPKEDYPKQIKEKMAELCVQRAKEDFKELLKRGEEIAKLTEELEESYEKNKKFNSKDAEKLQRVEKLLKKIRKELRAGKDKGEKEKDKPKSMLEAVKTLKVKTSKLFSELKKTSRYSISAVAIQSSNTVLKLVKFLRFRN